MRLNPRRSPRSRSAWARTVVTAAISLIVLMPFLWMISLSLKGAAEANSWPPRLIPDNPTMENFFYVWEKTNLPLAFANSTIVSVVAVLTNVVFAVAAGYAIARLPLRGKTFLFAVMIGCAMVPAVVQLIPMFLLTQHVPLAGGNDIVGAGGTGLLNTRMGLLLPLLIAPLNVYLARQAFLDLPDELSDAARIDGAGELRIFAQVFVPLARPIIATIAILTFTGAWEDFLWPLVIVSSPDLQTLPLMLSSFKGAGQVIRYGPMMASAIVATIPIVIVFSVGQRSFVQGLASGGVKG